MFTLTFVSGKKKTTVSAQRYDFVEHSGGQAAQVTVSKDFFDGGVEFRLADPVTNDCQWYTTCFVTNEAGKTIDRLGPYPPKRYDEGLSQMKSATA